MATNLKDLAHDVSRDTLVEKDVAERVLARAFGVILERVASGNEVHIHKFGSFKASLFKGRTLRSPLMDGGAVTFGDKYVLRFHQAPAAKREINEKAAKRNDAPPKAKRDRSKEMKEASDKRPKRSRRKKASKE